jgi:four helix bundle protein
VAEWRGLAEWRGAKPWASRAFVRMPSNFRSLVAYQRARALADDLHAVVVRWPSFERDTVGLQLVRAADSVAANIAEAGGRWTVADKRHFLIIARGSLYETEHWVDCARARGLINGDPSDRLAAIARALNGLVAKSRPK